MEIEKATPAIRGIDLLMIKVEDEFAKSVIHVDDEDEATILIQMGWAYSERSEINTLERGKRELAFIHCPVCDSMLDHDAEGQRHNASCMTCKSFSL